MKLQYASDLHLEFRQNQIYLTQNPLKKAGEILILAGDITYLPDVKQKLWFPDLFKEYEQVFIIPGNHEFYQNCYNIKDVFPSLNIKIDDNITYLNNQVIHPHEDLRIIFTTLWTYISKDQAIVEHYMPDFRNSQYDGRRFTVEDYNQCHLACRSFLETALQKEFKGNTVVVTHHAPFPPSALVKPIINQITPAFHVDLTHWLSIYKIDHWISGHTHINQKPFKIKDTRFHINCLGYTWLNNEGKDFNFEATIEL